MFRILGANAATVGTCPATWFGRPISDTNMVLKLNMVAKWEFTLKKKFLNFCYAWQYTVVGQPRKYHFSIAIPYTTSISLPYTLLPPVIVCLCMSIHLCAAPQKKKLNIK